MPKNKNALTRYKIINRMLLNGRFASKREMAEKCSDKLGVEVSIRTIENDLNAMRFDTALGYEAPIKYDHGKRAYYYTETDYSIDGLKISTEDLRNMQLVARMLGSCQNSPEFQNYGGSLWKVIKLLNYKRLHIHSRNLDFIEFEHHPPGNGKRFFGKLMYAIHTRTPIQLEYQPFGDKVKSYTLHPYYLKEYDQRWYLVAWCEERKAIRIFGLERMKEINRLHYKTFRPGPAFNAKQFFRDFIGLHVPDQAPEDIVVRMKNKSGYYLLTKPLHHSQQLTQKGDDWHEFRFHLAINPELIREILKWGKNAEVLQPESLKEMVEQAR